MRRLTFGFAVAVALLLPLAAFAASTPAASVNGGKTVCTSTFTGTAKDVVVPNGATCRIDDANITHDVTVQPGGSLDIDDSQVGHDLRADRAVDVFVCNVVTGHDLVVKRSTGRVSIGGGSGCENEIAHDLRVEDNAGSTGVYFNHAGHDAICKGEISGFGNSADHKNTCPTSGSGSP